MLVTTTFVADPWQARLDRLRRLLPVPLLALSAGAAALVPGERHGPLWLEVALVGVAAVWSIAVSARLRPDTPMWWRGVAFAVQVALGGALVWVHLTFGIFGYANFLFAYPLGPRWRKYGFTAAALVVAASMSGGYPVDGKSAVTYALVAGVLLALVLNSAGITNRALEQNQERGVMIAELAEANRRLEASMAENAELHQKLLVQAREAGVVEERQRLAGEIHDTLAQGLTAIIAQLGAAEHVRDEPAQLARHLELAKSLARSNLTEARRSVRALRPGQLEEASLPEAIAELARAWSERTGIATDVDVTGEPARASTDAESAVFRVAQEALSNVDKHANAKRVTVTLSYLGDAMLLDVHDDGTGFDPAGETDGYGLAGMRRRLESAGGQLTVESSGGYGTTINAALPMRGAVR